MHMMPWKCTQHTITITAHSFLDRIFTDPGDLAVQLLQMPFSMQTSLDMLPPPTHYFLLPISKEAFIGLLLQKNNKVTEASSALYFWDHHTAI